jgi:heterodisulfide reductase subunit B
MSIKMRYALYTGCTIQVEQFGYDMAVRRTMPELGVELVDMKGTSCCGFPIFSGISRVAWVYMSARNLAIAEEMSLPLLPLCNGCQLSFEETLANLEKDEDLRFFINEKLAEEGMQYRGKVEIVHLLSLLHDTLGVESIRESIRRPLDGLTLAAHPGCHAIRPSSMNRPDDPENPQKLDELIEALGAKSFDYPEKIDCCGSNLALTSGKTTLRIAGEKLKAIKSYGFDGMVTTCPFCFSMFDGKQRVIRRIMNDNSLRVPIFYYNQLLGLSMGLNGNKLGLTLNDSPIDPILKKINGGKNNE